MRPVEVFDVKDPQHPDYVEDGDQDEQPPADRDVDEQQPDVTVGEPGDEEEADRDDGGEGP